MTHLKEKPIIGLTVNNPDYAKAYADLIERHGGKPWLILPDHDMPPEETLSRLDGLLVCGGEDIHPRWYKEEPEPGVELVLTEATDSVELPVLEAALDADIPILCICRGMQALNVVMGGRLIQHMDDHSAFEQDGDMVSAYHRIFISPGSKLAAVVGSGGFVRVNSRHHQAIKEAQKSPALVASAYSLDDVYIEGLESQNHRWVIGVQFHPERRKEVPPHFDHLFENLVWWAAGNVVEV